MRDHSTPLRHRTAPSGGTRYHITMLLWLMMMLCGCARLQITGEAAQQMQHRAVATLTGVPLLAAAPGNQQCAVASNGLSILSLPSGKATQLSSETAQAVAWSSDGSRLAAAFPRENSSRIVQFAQDGSSISELTVAGHVSALFWTEAELLAFSTELELRSFGASCHQVLLRWKPGTPPERSVLNDVTLTRRAIQSWGVPLFLHLTTPVLSPLADELLYARIIAPPAFAPHLQLTVRNLANGAERQLTGVSLGEGSAAFTPAGDQLYHSSGGQTRQYDAWSGAEQPGSILSGQLLAVSPHGTLLMNDGRLLHGNHEIARFTPLNAALFLDQRAVLVADNSRLYTVSGIPAAARAPSLPPAVQERLRTLRAWRAAGLITSQEYQSAYEQVTK